MIAPAFADAVREAYALARDGQYQSAETLCEELLRQRDSAELWLLCGILRLQTGRAAEAVAAIRESLRRGETRPAAHALLGDALARSASAAEAVDSYDAALKLNPALVSAHLGKGSALLTDRRCDQALASFEKALALAPADAEAWYKHGLALVALERYLAARQSFDRALALQPQLASAHAARGAVYLKLNEPRQALVDLDAALLDDPAFIEALCNRGSALRLLSRTEQALESYESALRLRSTDLPALRGRAEVLREMRRPEEALAAFVSALEVQPDDADSLRGQGDALLDLSRKSEALALHERALRRAPHSSDVLNSVGNSLYALERLDAAIESYQRALQLDAGNAVAHFNLGTALLRAAADPRAVIEHFSAALAIRPEFPLLPGALAYAKRCFADWTAADTEAKALEEAALSGKPVAAPFHLLSIVESPETLMRSAETYLKFRLPPVSPWQASGSEADRLRIAYLSSDFREHALARLMSGVFEQHDRDRVEVVGVSLAPADDSHLGRRIRAAFDRWIDLSALADGQALAVLRELKIDIAVDLNGLTDGARPSLFQQRIAPLQVNYLGFPGTSGAPFMDYILADEFVIPPGQSAFYRERVIHLPCFQAFDDAPLAPRATSRASEGLPAEAFVFCCFNHTSKISPALFEVWVKILKQVPGGILWLLGTESATRDNLRREAEQRGLDPERLHFAGRVSREEFRSRLALADLFLDTLPFNAGATASEALAAGLPLVTATGRSFSSRMAGSLLLQINLPELVCRDLGEYELRSVQLARDPRALANVKERLARGGTSTLFNTRAFTRSLEQAFSHMQAHRLTGLPPKDFKV